MVLEKKQRHVGNDICLYFVFQIWDLPYFPHFFCKHLTTITLINIQLRSTPNPVIVTTRILTICLKGHPELNMFFAPGILGWGGYRVAAIDAANVENRRCRGLVFGALLGPETCQVVSGAQKIHKMMWQGFRLSNHPKVHMKVWMMYMLK